MLPSSLPRLYFSGLLNGLPAHHELSSYKKSQLLSYLVKILQWLFHSLYKARVCSDLQSHWICFSLCLSDSSFNHSELLEYYRHYYLWPFESHSLCLEPSSPMSTFTILTPCSYLTLTMMLSLTTLYKIVTSPTQLSFLTCFFFSSQTLQQSS